MQKSEETVRASPSTWRKQGLKSASLAGMNSHGHYDYIYVNETEIAALADFFTNFNMSEYQKYEKTSRVSSWI